jgi:hypothetical protein
MPLLTHTIHDPSHPRAASAQLTPPYSPPTPHPHHHTTPIPRSHAPPPQPRPGEPVPPARSGSSVRGTSLLLCQSAPWCADGNSQQHVSTPRPPHFSVLPGHPLLDDGGARQAARPKVSGMTIAWRRQEGPRVAAILFYRRWKDFFLKKTAVHQNRRPGSILRRRPLTAISQGVAGS